jgi:hypothetical protein
VLGIGATSKIGDLKMTTEQDSETIFVASIRLRNGKRIYAWQYGKKAFPIKVRRKRPKQPLLPGIE